MRQHPRDGVRRSLLPALVAVVVAGLFAMHALALHGHPGTSGSPMDAARPMAAGAHAGHAGGHTDAMVDAAAAAGTTSAARPSGPDRGWTMLCVAILTAAAGALLVLATLARRRHAARLGRPGTVAVTGRRRPPAGPPAFLRFSVIRC